MTEELIYVGIDVAKDRVDVATRPADQHWSVSYDEAGVEALVAKLQVLEPAAVILEATEGLELPLVAAVAAAVLPVAVVNPRQVRDFARSTGQLRQERPAERSHPGPLRGGGPSSDTPVARCRHPGLRGHAGRSSPDGRHPGGRKNRLSRALPAPSGGREAQETSPHRLYAKAANRAQQHGENWEGLESPPSRPLDTQDGCFSLNVDTLDTPALVSSR